MAHGDSDVALAYVPIMLGPEDMRWLQNLPPSPISSWPQFCEKFIAKFHGTYHQPAIVQDTTHIRQRRQETLKEYIWHFSELRNQVADVPNQTVIIAFKEGLQDERLLEQLAKKLPDSVESLFNIAN